MEDALVGPTLSLTAEQAHRLARYMPRHLIEKILASRDEVVGERKQATFLFADVVGSTTLGESYDEETFRTLMDGALRRMIDEVHHYEGTVGQLRGDEVFALFGVPLVHEDDPERAVRAAFGIQSSIREYAEQLSQTHGIEGFEVRVTLNTGDVVVGEIGGDLRAEYTAMGDAVNTAAKLQAVARPGSTVVTQETYRLVRHFVTAKPLGEVALKGKRDRVSLYDIMDVQSPKGRLRELEGLTVHLVGRTQEMQTLQRCHADLLEGVGQVVLVTGHAGIGKTRLVAELKARTPEGAASWLEGRCLSFGRSHSYHPFIAAIRSWLAINESDHPDVGRQKLQQGIGDLITNSGIEKDVEMNLAAMLGLDVLGEQQKAHRDPEEVRRGIERSLRAVLLRAAAVKPVVLYLEDLHWADRASVDLIKDIMACATSGPVMLLCVSRPDREGPIWELKASAERDTADRITWVELFPLSETESADLLTSMLKLPTLPAALRKGVLERAEGNPLFVEELLRAMIDRGSITRNGDGWAILDASASTTLPRLLLGIIADRIDGLGERPKRVLRAASVLGRRFPYPILQGMLASGGVQETGTAIGELIQAELITEVGEARGFAYSFRHDVIREVAYESMLGDERGSWHRLAGRTLQEHYAERADENAAVLAHHFHLGSEWESAEEYYVIAAERAQAIYSNIEAIDLYSAALDLGAHLGDAKRARAKYDALKGRAAVRARIGRTDDEAEDLAELRILSQQSGATAESAEVALLFSDHAVRTGQFEEALREAEKGRASFSQAQDEHGEGRALGALGTALSLLGSLDEARAKLGEALEVFRKLGDRAHEARIRKNLGTVRARLGALEQAVEQYTSAIGIYRELEDRSGESEILGNLGSLHYLQADYERAAASFSKAQEIFHELGNVRNEAKCLNNLGICCAALGDYEGAGRHHDKALGLYSEVGDDAGKANALSNLGIAQEALAVDGDPAFESSLSEFGPLVDEAETSHRRALELYDQAGDRVGIPRSHFNLGCTLTTKGDPGEALACLSEALRGARELGQRTLVGRVLAAMSRAQLLLGKKLDALESSSEAVSMLDETFSSEIDEIRFAHYRALMACSRQAEAAVELELAREVTQEKAARIRDTEAREAFLSAYKRLFEARSGGGE